MEIESDESNRSSSYEPSAFGFASTDVSDFRQNPHDSVTNFDIPGLEFNQDNSQNSVKEKVMEFLRSSTGYDVMLDRNNIIVLDSSIPMNLAFEAMIFHNVEHCPLWDSNSAQHVGILTATDMIHAMSFQSQNSPEYTDIHTKPISYYKTVQFSNNNGNNNNNTNNLILSTSYPEETLFDIIRSIISQKIHRIPLVDPNDHTVVAILSQLDILTYLLQRGNLDLEKLFDIEIGQLNIGQFTTIHTVRKSDFMSKVYIIMSTFKLSCIPVVDDNNVVIDIFSNNDIFQTFKTWNDSMSHFGSQIETILSVANKKHVRNKLKFFRRSETLCLILKKFVSENITQLICVDDSQIPVGIISLTDILNYFLT